MVAHKYGLENNRLQYKRIINKKEVWLNIPYENEVEPLLNYIHHNNIYIKRRNASSRYSKWLFLVWLYR